MSKHERLLGPYSRLEHKDNSTPNTSELKALTEELMRTVTAFREKTDQRFDDFDKRKADDTLVREQIDRINNAIDDIQKKATDEILEIKRQAIFSAANASEQKAKPPELVAYEKKFKEYLRKGGRNLEQELENLHVQAIEAKALVTNSEADGGYTVLPQMEQTFIELSLLISPVRQVANVVNIGSVSLKQPVNKHGATAGWVGEEDPRTATLTSQMAELEWVPGEIYCNVSASQQMLDDSYMNVEQWIASEFALAALQTEGRAFISGDGIKKPKGFLSYPVVADSSYAWGSVGYLPTGTSGGFTPVSAGPPLVQGADAFFDLIAALRYPYRPGARFVMNRRTVAKVRQLKDLFGNYLWQPGLQAGQTDTLLGYPLTEFEDMPDLAAGSYSIAFGDFRQFYQIVDRIGLRTLRDPFTNKPFVIFYTTKRVGGGIRNFEAAKLLKFSVS